MCKCITWWPKKTPNKIHSKWWQVAKCTNTRGTNTSEQQYHHIQHRHLFYWLDSYFIPNCLNYNETADDETGIIQLHSENYPLYKLQYFRLNTTKSSPCYISLNTHGVDILFCVLNNLSVITSLLSLSFSIAERQMLICHS